MHRIKSVKNLERLPSGNFLDTKTRIVYAKAAIEKEFGEDLMTVEVATKAKAEAKPKTKAKRKTIKK